MIRSTRPSSSAAAAAVACARGIQLSPVVGWSGEGVDDLHEAGPGQKFRIDALVMLQVPDRLMLSHPRAPHVYYLLHPSLQLPYMSIPIV